MGSGGSVPSKQAWNTGSFIYDGTQAKIKELWLTAPIRDYTIDQIGFQDFSGPFISGTKKMVAVIFFVSGEKYGAGFLIEKQGNEWYPVWGYDFSAGNFLIAFLDAQQ